MKLYGFGRLPIANLEFDATKMAGLVASVDRHRRYLYPKPIVSEKTVVAGSRSLAQEIVRLPPGSSVSVVATSCDEADAALLQEVERLCDEGRTSRAEAANMLVDHLTKSVMAQRPELREDGQGGRVPSARGIAREWTADLLGLQPASVARYDVKAQARVEKPPQVPFELNDWGLPYSQELLGTAIRWRHAAEQAIEQQRAVVKSLAGTPWQQQAAEHLEWLEGQVPEAICPYCKAWGWLKEQCPHCNGTGIAGRDTLAMSAVFVRLWKTDEYWGRDRDNNWVSLEEVRQ